MDPYFFASDYVIVRSASELSADYEPLPSAEAALVLSQLPEDDGTLVRVCDVMGLSASQAQGGRDLLDALGEELRWGVATVGVRRQATCFPRMTEASTSEEPSDLAPLASASAVVQEHWLEIQVVDEADEPVRGVRCVVELPNGVKRNARTDASGTLYIDGVTKPGDCKVRFPDMHSDTFEQA